MSSHVIKCHMSHVLPRLLQALTRYNTRIWIFLKVSMGISVIKKLFLILFVLCWDNNDFQFIYIETPLLTEFNYKLIWCLDITLLCHLPIPPPYVASYYIIMGKWEYASEAWQNLHLPNFPHTNLQLASEIIYNTTRMGNICLEFSLNSPRTTGT